MLPAGICFDVWLWTVSIRYGSGYVAERHSYDGDSRLRSANLEVYG
jgi:hypothetical protein